MKRNIIALTFLATLYSCAVQEIEPQIPSANNLQRGICAQVPDFEPCGIKTVITQNGSEAPTFAWKEGDVIGIVPDDGKTFQTNFTIEEVGSDPHFATFDGGAWALKKGSRYIAYNPCAQQVLTSKGSVTISNSGQTQSGNASTDHLGTYDYMYAAAESVAEGSVSFKFSHKISLLRIQLPITENMTVTSATLESVGGKFATEEEMAVADGSLSITASSSTLELQTTELALNAGEVATLWMAVLPSDEAVGKPLKIKIVTSTNKNIVYNLKNGFAFEAGRAYSIVAGKPEIRQEASLTFEEAASKYTYGSVKSYTNDGGEWAICCYSDGTEGTGFQINAGKVAYIGTPEFEGIITSLTIKTTKSYTGNFYLCSKGGTSTSAEGVLATYAAKGQTAEFDVSSLDVSQLFIRSNACANISAIELSIEGGDPVPVEDTPFTRLSELGFYANTNEDIPVHTTGIDPENGQYSLISSSSSRIFRIIDIQSGKVSQVKVNASSFKVGSEISIEECSVTDGQTVTRNVTVVKKSDKVIWLEDKAVNKGYIIEIK